MRWSRAALRLELFLDAAEALSTRPLSAALQRGLILVLPLVLAGAFALMVLDLPVPAARSLLDELFGPAWRNLCRDLVGGTLGVASLALLCTFSGSLASQHNRRHPDHFVNPVAAAGVAMACFFVLISPASGSAWKQSLSLDRGLLLALAVAYAATRVLLRLARSRALRLPLGQAGLDAAVRDALALLPAALLTLLLCALLRTLLSGLGLGELHGPLSRLLARPFAGMEDGLGFGLLYSGLSQLLWFFGLHGPNVLFGVEDGILVPAAAANTAAMLGGNAPPFVFTKQFFDAFTRMGGSGCTLCLIAAVLLKGRTTGARKLCLLALAPALCNVNEPLIFGIPLVLNPLYGVPFLLVPLAQTFTAWAATVAGLVPRTLASEMAWTTPVLVSGYTATGSLAGAALQVLNLALGAACYLPFVALADRLGERRSKRSLGVLLEAAASPVLKAGERPCLSLRGEAGRLAKVLALDLERALRSGAELFMVYQPQVDGATGRAAGVEALLRWRHPVYGDIPPPVIVSLAEETGRIEDLGVLALRLACLRRMEWEGRVPEGLVMSVNVSPRQLRDPFFGAKVRGVLAETGLSPTQLELEITESVSMSVEAGEMETLRSLRALGVRVAIDDFGMGHTSLRYLREFPVDTVKIDRSLTNMDAQDVNLRIVRSIVELCRALDIVTLVEGVERQEQLAAFMGLGCELFQGYYFSRPLPGEACLEFIRERLAEPEPEAPLRGSLAAG